MIFCVSSLFAQKPLIDSTAYKAWPSLGWSKISKNGQYVFYTIEGVPVGSKTLIVQSTDGKWKKEFNEGLKDGSLRTLSDKYFFFINKNDSLGMLILGTSRIKYIPKISSCRLFETGDRDYIGYPSKSNSKTLLIRDLSSNKERSFTDVNSWNFNEDVLILYKSAQGNDQKQTINIADIITGKVSKIWEGYKPENLILDVKHRQLAFKAGDSIWHYKFDSANAVCISDRNSSGITAGLTLGYLESFSRDGKFILTSLNGKKEAIKPKNGVVEIWSYTDVQLQTEQEKATIDQRYVAVIDVDNHRLIRLQQQAGEDFQFSKSEDDITKVALVMNPLVVDRQNIWNTAIEYSWDLVTLKNGNRKRLNFLDGMESAILSPSAKYILYFDKQKQVYFSYEIATERLQNLTKGLNVSWTDINRDDMPDASSFGRGGLPPAWLKDDESVLVYDRYDIWKLDPSNKETPINLTNGYGKRNQIIFDYAFASDEVKIIAKNEKLYLTAFNKENKKNGFFLKQLDKAGDPELLHMAPYLYKTNSGYVPGGSDFSPIKATKSEMYVVRRMSSTDAPNYFSTKDFKNFTRLSDLQPQKKYNWYTTELHTWKSLDGRKLQGILYKPENFDPNKKYPVIFHYYERKSDGLNVFITPELLCNGCQINIPTYVSHGYLVFTPDIYYKIGDPMQGTYDAIISAASYLSTLPFVNDKKMGLQGCSYGGLQTNYLITHSDKFAAAVSSSGLSNMISAYGDIYPDEGSSMEVYFEPVGQARMGKSLWAIPESYIKSSPIFNIHMVKTPVLIMHTRKDGSAASYKDAQQFFTGLRRMGKKTWMLAYSEGDHGILGKEADDFSIRMLQFFDHYLKDKPAPLWMVDGVSAENRSWKAGLELDTKGRTPGPGLLIPSEQAKVDSLMTRKPITITLK